MTEFAATVAIFAFWLLSFVGTVLCFPKQERKVTDLFPLILVAPLSFVLMSMYRLVKTIEGPEMDKQVVVTEAYSYNDYLRSIIEED